jgi:hypothetical protein
MVVQKVRAHKVVANVGVLLTNEYFTQGYSAQIANVGLLSSTAFSFFSVPEPLQMICHYLAVPANNLSSKR